MPAVIAIATPPAMTIHQPKNRLGLGRLKVFSFEDPAVSARTLNLRPDLAICTMPLSISAALRSLRGESGNALTVLAVSLHHPAHSSYACSL